MTMQHRNKLARAWLVRNDPDYDWGALPADTDFIGAVADNLGTFGPDESRASRFFMPRRKYQ